MKVNICLAQMVETLHLTTGAPQTRSLDTYKHSMRSSCSCEYTHCVRILGTLTITVLFISSLKFICNILVEKMDDKTCSNELFHTKRAWLRIINVYISMIYLDLLYISLFLIKQHLK